MKSIVSVCSCGRFSPWTTSFRRILSDSIDLLRERREVVVSWPLLVFPSSLARSANRSWWFPCHRFSMYPVLIPFHWLISGHTYIRTRPCVMLTHCPDKVNWFRVHNFYPLIWTNCGQCPEFRSNPRLTKYSNIVITASLIGTGHIELE